MSEQEEREQRDAEVAALRATATPAGADLETALARLQDMIVIRRKDPKLEAEYEALRDEVVKYLRENGPRYYLDGDGCKRYAFAVIPEKTVVNVDALESMVQAGELSPYVLEQIAPRKANIEAFRRACQTERLTDEQIVAATSSLPGTGFVKVSDPSDG